MTMFNSYVKFAERVNFAVKWLVPKNLSSLPVVIGTGSVQCEWGSWVELKHGPVIVDAFQTCISLKNDRILHVFHTL